MEVAPTSFAAAVFGSQRRMKTYSRTELGTVTNDLEYFNFSLGSVNFSCQYIY